MCRLWPLCRTPVVFSGIGDLLRCSAESRRLARAAIFQVEVLPQVLRAIWKVEIESRYSAKRFTRPRHTDNGITKKIDLVSIPLV